MKNSMGHGSSRETSRLVAEVFGSAVTAASKPIMKVKAYF